ncbi:MAG: D-amino acid dehydrogenase [Burkholderiales bacterium]|nr:D-amino acid dehydrogenase [Burkholderiales bacterium]
MRVLVIGGGIIGVTTAYSLRQRGLEVTVLERNAGVAQEASFANAGVIAPSYAAPWAQPGMPKKVLAQLFRRDAAVVFRPTRDRALWRWLRQWYRECELERFARNKARMQRLASYSRAQLHEVAARHAIDYEQARGYLQLFRNADELERNAPARKVLQDLGVSFRQLTETECRQIEPTLTEATPLAGGVYMPDDESGNCAYFARRLKEICEGDGVEFRFGARVTGLTTGRGRIESVQTADGPLPADAYVLAAGCDSAQLLTGTGIDVPLYPVQGYSATAQITRHEHAPLLSIMDETYKVAVTRLGNRLRVAGIAEIGKRAPTLRTASLRTLLRVAQDWFPAAASWSSAQYWVGARPMLPDGPPLLGATPLSNLYLNIGHGSTGWAMACGSGQVLADVVTGRAPAIGLDGLTLARYH